VSSTHPRLPLSGDAGRQRGVRSNRDAPELFSDSAFTPQSAIGKRHVFRIDRQDKGFSAVGRARRRCAEARIASGRCCVWRLTGSPVLPRLVFARWK
jgi:hypothetical protein